MNNLGEDGFRWFIGVVEDNNDPLKLGRCRVRVLNEYNESVDTENLPWAQMLMPNTSASQKGLGVSPTGIDKGTNVIGFFVDGNAKQLPMIMGTFHTIPEMKEENHGVAELARGLNISKETTGNEPPSSYGAEYPYNKVFSTSSGHIVEFDDTPSKERIHLFHKSGSYTEINSEGRRVDKIVGDGYSIFVKDNNIHVEGKVNITSKGDINISSDKEVNINAKGNINIKGKKVNIT